MKSHKSAIKVMSQGDGGFDSLLIKYESGGRGFWLTAY